jgi:uncharacterized protein YbjQ (UPF0145 family)
MRTIRGVSNDRHYRQRRRGASIIGMRCDATEFVQGATEVLAYGTAVKLSN